MNPKGFTLIELAIVLFIVGLLMAGFLAPLAESINQERRAKTQTSLDEIKEALYGYLISNGRMPCPDCRANAVGNCPGAGNTLNDGVEDLIGNNCAVDPVGGGPGLPNEGHILEGNLPWATLSVKSTDEWGSWFTYAVTDSAADIVPNNTPGNPFPPLLPPCLNPSENLATVDICTVGNITIQNQGTNPGVCPAAPPNNTVAQVVYAVVVSHGANITRTPGAPPGLINQPPLCSEWENWDLNGTFVSSTYINPSNNTNALGIDDMVIWISPNVIKNKLIQAGRLP